MKLQLCFSKPFWYQPDLKEGHGMYEIFYALISDLQKIGWGYLSMYSKQSTTEGPFFTDLKALTLNMNNEYLIFETSASKLSKSTIF